MFDFFEHPIIREDLDNIFCSRKSWEELRHSSFYIAGATGMLASYFVYFLLDLNERHHYDIHIYAGGRSPQKAAARFGPYLKRDYFHWVQADVTAEVPIAERVDYVVHAASLASPQYYGEMPVETMLPNIIGTYHLLEYARRVGVKAFLFFSSGATSGTMGRDTSEEAIGMLDFLAPENVYAESKRCGEALCRAYFREYGVPIKSARISHTYGPTMDIINDKRMFSEFVKNLVDRADIVLKSNGSAKRPLCYISDGISALYTILLDGQAGDSYNLANSEECFSVRELAHTLVDLYPERGLRVVFQNREDEADYPKGLEENAGLPPDTRKLRLLGWVPRINVQDGFRRVIDYFEKRK